VQGFGQSQVVSNTELTKVDNQQRSLEQAGGIQNSVLNGLKNALSQSISQLVRRKLCCVVYL